MIIHWGYGGNVSAYSPPTIFVWPVGVGRAFEEPDYFQVLYGAVNQRAELYGIAANREEIYGAKGNRTELYGDL